MPRLSRPDRRRANELRPVTLQPGYLKFAHGSVLAAAGDTQVLCAANLLPRIPDFLRGTGKGWITAEYGMLPSSTPTRRRRDATLLHPDGRTQEIRRLIGRALRAAVDLRKLGERTVWIDCDVLQADGGTRTLSITGAWIALAIAVKRLCVDGTLDANPITRQIAAVSVGIVNGHCVLDLPYAEDSKAEVDMNIVMTRGGRFIEVQGTAESEPFTQEQNDKLLALARSGCKRLMRVQRETLKLWEDEGKIE